jgi:glutamyl-tRNA synthetase
MRQIQEETKIKPGYYGTWAKWRDAKIELIEEMLKKGESYVIRFKSLGDETRNFTHHDLLKGDIVFPENDIDIIIMKTDGLPTYHLAHVIDDYLMRTSHVFRGDEWVSSIPLHYELFKAFDFKIPFYGHIAPISKIDENGGKRKLSKRKDPEANISFYEEKGYPNAAVMEYLMNLINSNFEDWRKENPDKSYVDFQLDLNKFSKSAGPLLDEVKLKDVAKGIVAKMSSKEMYKNALDWAKKYDAVLHGILKNQSYWEKIFSMEKDAKNPRKDMSCWSEIKYEFFYFIPGETVKPDWSIFSSVLNTEEIKEVIDNFKEVYKIIDSSEEWMKKIAEISSKFNLAPDIKTYKKNKDNYKGHIGEVAQVIRYAITGKTKTPDLYQIMQILGEEEVKKRLVC